MSTNSNPESLLPKSKPSTSVFVSKTSVQSFRMTAVPTIIPMKAFCSSGFPAQLSNKGLWPAVSM